jgi:pentatricopeptide repeat protein
MKASCSEWRLVEPLLRDSLKTKWDKDIAANYALAIEAALNHGEVKPARRLYLEASLLNVVGRWSASFFTRSTHAFVKAGALEVALEIWSGVIMKHGLCGVEVSEVSDELLGACVKAGRWDEAFDLIDVLRSSQRPSRRTFTNLITPQNPEMILRLFQELIREDAKPQM